MFHVLILVLTFLLFIFSPLFFHNTPINQVISIQWLYALFFFVKSTVVCITRSYRWDFLQWNTLAITRQGLPILWDLHWKCSSSPRATGPPPLFHGYLDTHSPEWRHTAMNPGICDPATDRHSSATDSIKLQIKAGTSKGLCGGSMEMWQWEGERKWVRGE